MSFYGITHTYISLTLPPQNITNSHEKKDTFPIGLKVLATVSSDPLSKHLGASFWPRKEFKQEIKKKRNYYTYLAKEYAQQFPIEASIFPTEASLVIYFFRRGVTRRGTLTGYVIFR